MRCWGELKSLRGQSVGKVRLVMRAIFRICGNQSQPGLQIVEKLATPLPGNDHSSGCARASDSHILTYLTFLSFIAPYPPPSIWSLVVDSKGPLQFPWVSLEWQQREKLGVSHDWRLEWIFLFSFGFRCELRDTRPGCPVPTFPYFLSIFLFSPILELKAPIFPFL